MRQPGRGRVFRPALLCAANSSVSLGVAAEAREWAQRNRLWAPKAAGTMISALFFINQKGEPIISRMYRDGFTRTVAETFRTHVIANKDERSPIKVVGETVFMYVKHGNMFVVAVASGNAQAAMTFQFLHSVVTVLKSYFGAFDEDSIRNNFVLIYELLDEMLDYGYPQNCTTDVLKMYITQEGNKSAALAQKEMASSVTIQATGAISWRKEGIKYRKNELFIDVVEHCNLMMSSKGTILRNDVSGVILVKCYLSGTPGAPVRVRVRVRVMGRGRGRVTVRLRLQVRG